MLHRVLSLLIGNKGRVLIGSLSLLGFLIVGAGGYIKGSSKATVACAEARTEGILEGERVYEDTKKDVMRLSPDTLDNRLTNWMRD